MSTSELRWSILDSMLKLNRAHLKNYHRILIQLKNPSYPPYKKLDMVVDWLESMVKDTEDTVNAIIKRIKETKKS